jgi:hypothetical protein
MTVFVDVVLVVRLGDDTGGGGSAVTAHSHGRATLSIVPASSLVNSACLICNIVILDPLVSVVGITTVAAIVGLLAGDKHLRGQIDIGPLGVANNLDSV